MLTCFYTFWHFHFHTIQHNIKAIGSSPVGLVWAGPTFGAWWGVAMITPKNIIGGYGKKFYVIGAARVCALPCTCSTGANPDQLKNKQLQQASYCESSNPKLETWNTFTSSHVQVCLACLVFDTWLTIIAPENHLHCFSLLWIEGKNCLLSALSIVAIFHYICIMAYFTYFDSFKKNKHVQLSKWLIRNYLV